MQRGNVRSLLHLHLTRAAFGNAGDEIARTHARNQPPADANRILKIVACQPPGPRHAGAALFDCTNLKTRNQIQEFGQRRLDPQGLEVTGRMVADDQVERLEIGSQPSLGMQLQQEIAGLDYARGDDVDVGVVDQHRVFLFQAQRGCRLGANDLTTFPRQVGQRAEVLASHFTGRFQVAGRNHRHARRDLVGR